MLRLLLLNGLGPTSLHPADACVHQLEHGLLVVTTILG